MIKNPQEVFHYKTDEDIEFEAQLSKTFANEFIVDVFERYYTAW